ncbi:hypothetical protein MFRU_066g00150 [Monilinia fructicola]|nr:hypothetical protein MFRU_066g00150 [Monilinia fructicola]
MDAQDYFELRVPAEDSPSEIFEHLTTSEASQQLNWLSAINDPSTTLNGVTLVFISPGGNALALDHADFLTFRQAEEEIPFLSFRELRTNFQLHGERRRAVLRCSDGRARLINLQIMTNYADRIAGIEKILTPVDIEPLDSEKCNICHEIYDLHAAPFTHGQRNHEALKMANCGHVFGRDCITTWLRTNDTCPLCRDRLDLPVAYNLRATVRW